MDVGQKMKESYHVVIGDGADTRHEDVGLHLSHALCRSKRLGQSTVQSFPRLLVIINIDNNNYRSMIK